MKYTNYGLGLMTEKERQKLLEIGAIKTIEGEDVIARDGYCVNVYERGEPRCVFEGNEFSCEQERDRIKSLKPNMKVEIKSYPKAYPEYVAKKSGKAEYAYQESKNLDEIVEGW